MRTDCERQCGERSCCWVYYVLYDWCWGNSSPRSPHTRSILIVDISFPAVDPVSLPPHPARSD